MHRPHLYTNQSPETRRGDERRSGLGRPLPRPGIPPRSTPTLSSPTPSHLCTQTSGPDLEATVPPAPGAPHPHTPKPRVFGTAASGCPLSALEAPGAVKLQLRPQAPGCLSSPTPGLPPHPRLQPRELLTGKLLPPSPTQFKALAPLGQGRRRQALPDKCWRRVRRT